MAKAKLRTSPNNSNRCRQLPVSGPRQAAVSSVSMMISQPVVAAIEALVGEQPNVRVLDDAASGAQPGPVRLASLADKRQDAFGRAKPAVLGAVICGIGIEPGDRSAAHQSAAQQGGKLHCVVYVGGGRQSGKRDAVACHDDM